jgi:hypothetical protein
MSGRRYQKELFRRGYRPVYVLRFHPVLDDNGEEVSGKEYTCQYAGCRGCIREELISLKARMLQLPTAEDLLQSGNQEEAIGDDY